MGWFRDGYRFSRVAAGLALLALAGVLAPLFGWQAAAGAAAAGVACLSAGLARRRDAYDLKALWDEPPAAEGDLVDPPDDFLAAGEPGAAYCGWCDEPSPPGAHRCRGCGRPLR
jgi:hypothetical protein